MTSALTEPPGYVCSACLGTPAVVPLSVMQLAALLGLAALLLRCWFRMGLGVVLSQLSCSPLVFFFCACAASPSTASPLGFCPLTGWVGMSVSSLLVYSLVWRKGACCDFFLGACALFSLLQVHWVFWASPAPLACWGGWGFAPCVRVFQLHVVCLVCRWGSPAAFSLP